MTQLLVQKIAQDYFGKEAALSWRKISGGLTNHNYLLKVNNEQEYFLKIFRYSEPERIQSVIKILRALRELDFDTPALIPMPNGNFLWSEKERQAMMTEYLTGEEPQQNLENLFRMGHTLGSLHHLNDRIKRYAIRGYSISLGGERMIAESRPLPEDLSRLLEEGLPFAEKIPYSRLPAVVIHGDLFLDNAILRGSRLYLFDFEGGCIDNALFDISRGIIGCATRDGKIDLTLGRAFLDGYQSRRRLLPLEVEYLYEFLIYAGMLSVLWRYNEFRIRREETHRADLYQELLTPTNNLLQLGKESVLNALMDEL